MNRSRCDLPSRWKLEQLGQICELESGGTPSRNVADYWGGSDIRWLSAKHIENDKVIGWDFITSKGLENSTSKLTNVGDVILVTRVSVGKMVVADGRYAVNQDLTILKAKNIHKIFLFHVLKKKAREFVEKSQGLAIKGITKDELKRILIKIPPLSEQEKIARILSCWDDAIEQTQNLIAEKKELKRGLMQQLLTGKKRLVDAKTAWNWECVADLVKKQLVSIEKGTSLTSAELQSGSIPVIAGGKSVPYYHNKYTHDFPCITISASGAYAGYVWRHSEKIWASDCSVAWGSDGYDTIFLGYCLENLQTNIYRLQTGGAQPHVYPDAIKILKLPLIPIAEQRAIADILTKADTEIDLLNKKLDGLKEQKKGLMQKLLTGEIRVKVDKKD